MKTFFSLSILSLIIGITGCTKVSNSPDGGTWTHRGPFVNRIYKSVKSHMYPATGRLAAQSAIATSDTSYSEIDIDFCTLRAPTQSGIYNVVDENTCSLYAPSSHNVILGNGAYFYSEGNDNKTVTVTVNNGRVNISGSNIKMIQHNIYTNVNDTSYIDLDIKQTD